MSKVKFRLYADRCPIDSFEKESINVNEVDIFQDTVTDYILDNKKKNDKLSLVNNFTWTVSD